MPFEASCAHDHDCEAEDCSGSWSLYKHIDMQKVGVVLLLYTAAPLQRPR